jgi:hypothetical protein
MSLVRFGSETTPEFSPNEPVTLVAAAGSTPARDARDSSYYPFEVLGKQALIIAISAAAGRLVLRLRI